MRTESEFSLEQNAEWIRLRMERRQAREAALLANLTSHDLSPEDHDLPLNEERTHNIIAWAGLLLRKDEQYEMSKKQISSQSMKDKKDQQSLVVDVQNKDEECYGAHSFNDNGEFIRSSLVINQELPKPGSKDTLMMMPQPSLFQPPGMDKTDTKLLDFFYNILAKKGQMDLADSELEEYIELLSEKSQTRIFSFGGLGSYLCTDPRFSVSQNIASIVSSGDYPWQEEKYSYGNGNQFNLNPGAKEFIPQRASHVSVLSEKHDRNQNMSPFTNVALNAETVKQLSLFGNDKNDGIPVALIERNAHVPDLCSHSQPVTNKHDSWSSNSAMGETTLMSSVRGTSPYTPILKAVHGVDEEKDDESDFFFTSQKITSPGTLLDDHTRMQPVRDKSAAICKTVSATMNQDADQSLFIQPLNAPLTLMQSLDRRVETLSNVSSKEFIRSSLVINQELPKPGSEDTLMMMPHTSPIQPPGMDKTDTKLLDFFYNILAKKGQMNLADSELEEYIELLSEKSQTRIFSFGGLGSYLCTDPRFKVSQNIASIVSSGDYPWQEEKYSYGNGNQFNLNPGAKEFIPQRASHVSVLSEKHDRNQNMSPFTNVALNAETVKQLSLFGNDKNDGIPVALIERNAHVPDLCSHSQPVTNKHDSWSSNSAMGETTLMSSVRGTSPYTPILKAVHGVDEEKDDESDFFFTSQKITFPGTLLDDHTRMQPVSDKSAAICKAVSATMNQDADQSLIIQPLNAPLTFMQSLDRRVETLSNVSSKLYVHLYPPSSDEGNEEIVSSITSEMDSSFGQPLEKASILAEHKVAETQTDINGIDLEELFVELITLNSILEQQAATKEALNSCQEQFSLGRSVTDELKQDVTFIKNRIQMAESSEERWKENFATLAMDHEILKFQNQAQMVELKKQLEAEQITPPNFQEALTSCHEQLSHGRSMTDELKHDVTNVNTRIQMTETSVDSDEGNEEIVSSITSEMDSSFWNYSYGVLQGHQLPALGNDSNRLTSDQDNAPLTSDQDGTPLTSDQDSTPLTSDQDNTTLTSDLDSAPLTGHEQPDVSEPLSSKGCFCVQEDSWMKHDKSYMDQDSHLFEAPSSFHDDFHGESILNQDNVFILSSDKSSLEATTGQPTCSFINLFHPTPLVENDSLDRSATLPSDLLHTEKVFQSRNFSFPNHNATCERGSAFFSSFNDSIGMADSLTSSQLALPTSSVCAAQDRTSKIPAIMMSSNTEFKTLPAVNFSLPSSSGSNYCKTPGHKRHCFCQPLEKASILAEHKVAETQTDINGIDLEELFVELITINSILKQHAATKKSTLIICLDTLGKICQIGVENHQATTENILQVTLESICLVTLKSMPRHSEDLCIKAHSEVCVRAH